MKTVLGTEMSEDAFREVSKDTFFAALDAKDAEIERLKGAIAKAYGYLWCVNCEPATHRQYPPERAAYAARKELRDLLTKEQRGSAINAAVQEVHETVRAESIHGA